VTNHGVQGYLQLVRHMMIGWFTAEIADVRNTLMFIGKAHGVYKRNY